MALVLDGNGTMTVGNGDITGITTGAIEATAIGTGALLQRQVYPFVSQQIITSQSFVDVFTASFTPKRSNSRIYLYCNLSYGKRSSGELQFPHRFRRNDSDVTWQLTWSSQSNFDVMRFPDTANGSGHMHILYQAYDEPATTSSITYKFQLLKTNSGYTDVYVNFGSNSGTSNIIIDEIAQ
jgi:hypothetical protein